MTLVRNSNPYEVAFSWMFDALHRLGVREYEQAEASAARALDLAEKYQIPQPAAYTRFALGQARAQLGRTAEGIALIRQGLAAMLDIGMLLTVPYVIAELAVAQELEGLTVDALETVEQSLQTNPKELLFYRPEALRLRGELRRKQGQKESAQSDFHEAIALAQRMSAKHPELRSTMSLARLLDSQGKRGEARAMLADIYGWFTEGFDTADLKDARSLLEQLGG